MKQRADEGQYYLKKNSVQRQGKHGDKRCGHIELCIGIAVQK